MTYSDKNTSNWKLLAFRSSNQEHVMTGILLQHIGIIADATFNRMEVSSSPPFPSTHCENPMTSGDIPQHNINETHIHISPQGLFLLLKTLMDAVGQPSHLSLVRF